MVWLAQKLKGSVKIYTTCLLLKGKANSKLQIFPPELLKETLQRREVNFQNIHWPLTTKGIKGYVLRGKRGKNTFKCYNQKRNKTGLKFVLPHLLFSMQVNKRPPTARMPRYHCRTKVPNIEVFTHTQKRKSASIQKGRGLFMLENL